MARKCEARSLTYPGAMKLSFQHSLRMHSETQIDSNMEAIAKKPVVVIGQIPEDAAMLKLVQSRSVFDDNCNGTLS